MSLQSPFLAPVEREVVHPAYCPIPIGDDLYKCTNKVTLCGPTGQLHVIAAIYQYMHRKEWNWKDGDKERHVKNEAITKHFTGLPALAILKATAVAEIGAAPSSALREPLWYSLALQTDEVPVLATFVDVPESFKHVLMDEIHAAVTGWRGRDPSTEPNSLLHLPRMAQREPGDANSYWRVPWVCHHVLARAVPKPNGGLLLRTNSAFLCDIQVPQLGRSVLDEHESTLSADHQLGRSETFGKPWLFRSLPVDDLAHQFVDAAIHLEKALVPLQHSEPGAAADANNHRCVELLRIMLIRDLVETYGRQPQAWDYRLSRVHVAACCTLTNRDERSRLQAALKSHLSNPVTRAHLMDAFVRKYCGGEVPRLMIPHANSDEHKGQIMAECLSTIVWFEEKLRNLTEQVDRERD